MATPATTRMAMNSPNPSTTPATSAARVPQPQSWLHALWGGRNGPTIRWQALISVIIATLLGSLAYTVALATLRWTMPLKLVGWLCLLLSALALIWCVRATLTVILHLGVKRLLVLLLILYIVAVVVIGSLVPNGGRGVEHWRVIAVEVLLWPIRGLGATVGIALDAPNAVGFAASGRRAPIKIPGIEWAEGVPPTPIVVTDRAASVEDTATEEQPTPIAPSIERPLRVGDTVQVIGTEGVSLRARSEPSTSAKIAARFSPGSLLRITDGPQTAEGRTWWKVKSDQGEGWCAAEFLTLAE